MCLMAVMSHLPDEIVWSPVDLMEGGVHARSAESHLKVSDEGLWVLLGDTSPRVPLRYQSTSFSTSTYALNIIFKVQSSVQSYCSNGTMHRIHIVYQDTYELKGAFSLLAEVLSHLFNVWLKSFMVVGRVFMSFHSYVKL